MSHPGLAKERRCKDKSRVYPAFNEMNHTMVSTQLYKHIISWSVIREQPLAENTIDGTYMEI